jgi:hypothetical protein
MGSTYGEDHFLAAIDLARPKAAHGSDMERYLRVEFGSVEREGSGLIPGSQFDCFEDFGEWHSCSLVHCRDVRR